MTRRYALFSLIGSGLVGLMLAGVSEASVPRAFVSINGSDGNPCSAVQPCRSFDHALTVVQPGGEIVVQNSGGYSTGFTITQSVTIDAAGFNASVISTDNTDLCTINAGASDRVVLRGISFHGASLGRDAIAVTQVGSLYIEHCSIAEFAGDGVHMGNGGDLWVSDTDVRKCANDGLEIDPGGARAANLVANDSRFTECASSGVLLSPTSTGPASGWMSNCTASLCFEGFAVRSVAAANASLTLTRCRASGNINAGLSALATSTGNAILRIANCLVTKNGIGVVAISSQCLFGPCGIAVVIGTSPGTNSISGNGADGTVSDPVTLQ
jgi:hypothetical protein